MKKIKNRSKNKLTLSRTTLRELSSHRLSQIAGGTDPGEPQAQIATDTCLVCGE